MKLNILYNFISFLLGVLLCFAIVLPILGNTEHERDNYKEQSKMWRTLSGTCDSALNFCTQICKLRGVE